MPGSNVLTPSRSGQQTTENTPTKEKRKASEKWRSLPKDKQMKLYENTLFPHIKHVMQKFSSQLPKDDLKKFAKEVGKKLVASDFKNNRVEDPTKITEKQERKVKSYVKVYFEKAVKKRKDIDQKKREKEKAKAINGPSSNGTGLTVNGNSGLNGETSPTKEDSDAEMSDNEDNDLGASFADAPSPSPTSPLESPDLKRKRDNEESGTPSENSESNKRIKNGNDDSVDSPPPPPPPPPTEGMPDAELQETETFVAQETEEERELREQEEALMRENEEAVLMDLDGTLKAEERVGKLHNHHMPHLNGNGLVVGLQADKDRMEGMEESEIIHERKSVLSH